MVCFSNLIFFILAATASAAVSTVPTAVSAGQSAWTGRNELQRHVDGSLRAAAEYELPRRRHGHPPDPTRELLTSASRAPTPGQDR